MIFDVMLRTGHNAEGKPIIRVYRVHDSKLNEILSDAQDEEYRILSVRPLFKKRPEVSEEDRKPFLIKKDDAVRSGIIVDMYFNENKEDRSETTMMNGM
jgi:hypothetical protein